EAVDRARRGDGPTLIEALTYRVGAHSTADDATRYRGAEDVDRARAVDPIVRFRAWLRAAGHADDEVVARFEAEADAFAADVRAGLVAEGDPPDAWMFDWVYADPPSTLERQRREALG
ncbi:MAG TPA: thiamine pyrophosphate-dependent enzyme, partial [Actinomycetota bacterium]